MRRRALHAPLWTELRVTHPVTPIGVGVITGAQEPLLRKVGCALHAVFPERSACVSRTSIYMYMCQLRHNTYRDKWLSPKGDGQHLENVCVRGLGHCSLLRLRDHSRSSQPVSLSRVLKVGNAPEPDNWYLQVIFRGRFLEILPLQARAKPKISDLRSTREY